jgi:hypothetical protein
MPRKGKSKGVQPSSSRSPTAANKYGRWRSAVEEILRSRLQGSLDVASIAATVVGMFDSGATDAEVAAFLHSQELSAPDEQPLADDARMDLVRELHRSAGSDLSLRPSNDEL